MSGTPRLRTVIVLFTRDLRVHDNPALELAVRSAEHVVPLFVLHEGLRFAVPNRARFCARAWRTCARACVSGAATWCCAAATRSRRRCGSRPR